MATKAKAKTGWNDVIWIERVRLTPTSVDAILDAAGFDVGLSASDVPAGEASPRATLVAWTEHTLGHYRPMLALQRDRPRACNVGAAASAIAERATQLAAELDGLDSTTRDLLTAPGDDDALHAVQAALDDLANRAGFVAAQMKLEPSRGRAELTARDFVLSRLVAAYKALATADGNLPDFLRAACSCDVTIAPVERGWAVGASPDDRRRETTAERRERLFIALPSDLDQLLLSLQLQ